MEQLKECRHCGCRYDEGERMKFNIKHGLIGDRDLYHSCIELCDNKYRDKWGNYDGN